MQLQFLTRAELILFIIYSFSRCAVCHVYTFIKNGTFRRCGRSKAWNNTHHGRYVFQTRFFREKYFYIYICTCTHIHIHVHLHVHIHIQKHAHIHVRVRVCLCFFLLCGAVGGGVRWGGVGCGVV